MLRAIMNIAAAVAVEDRRTRREPESRGDGKEPYRE